jgi:EAL domain-containing protein (putative c-di-GMP-specific phosphodiesterase class I)
MEQAAVQALRWRHQVAPELAVTVNVSARELSGPELAGTVAETLIRTGLPAAALCIEMTESAVTEDVESAFEAMRDLKDLGVTISVDEFGIGTSTIGLLRRVPDLDSLKIDPLFVAGLDSPGGRADLVGVIVGMARTMGMSAVAEGVETEAQVEALRQLGCDAAQGHHLGGPAPPEEVEALLRDTASRP